MVEQHHHQTSPPQQLPLQSHVLVATLQILQTVERFPEILVRYEGMSGGVPLAATEATGSESAVRVRNVLPAGKKMPQMVRTTLF